MKQPYLWKVWFKTDDFIKWDYLVIYAPNEEKAREEAKRIKPNTEFYDINEAIDCYGFKLDKVANNIREEQ